MPVENPVVPHVKTNALTTNQNSKRKILGERNELESVSKIPKLGPAASINQNLTAQRQCIMARFLTILDKEQEIAILDRKNPKYSRASFTIEI